MEFLEWTGWFAAVVVGVVLGFLGGGGSTLAVPTLVYLLDVPADSATGYSLFIVGLSALVGTYSSSRHGHVAWRTGFLFALPSMVAVFAVQRWVLPAIPASFELAGHPFGRNQMIMFLFALLMVGAAWSMIRKTKEVSPVNQGSKAVWLVPLEGLIIGGVTGLVGAGGGFLIIPALVFLVGLDIKKAIGTSLFIIAMKSGIGFFGALGNGLPFDWNLLLPFAGLTMVGALVGVQLRKKADPNSVKTLFGWFLIVTAFLILAGELS